MGNRVGIEIEWDIRVRGRHGVVGLRKGRFPAPP